MDDVFVVSYSHLYLCVLCIQVQNSTCIQYILKLDDIQNNPACMQEYFMSAVACNVTAALSPYLYCSHQAISVPDVSCLLLHFFCIPG